MAETFCRERPQEQLAFTGERLTGAATGQVEIEHLHRYFLARDLGRGRDVLDIASGEGYGAAMLAQVANSVVGVDISEQTVSFASRNYQKDNLSFRVGDARNIPLPDAAVDVVVSFETIEHLYEHEQFMSEIKRVLRPGGLLVMSSPDRDVYSSRGDTANPFHVRELTAAAFTGLLARYFAHVAASGQRCFLGSALLPLQGEPAGVRSFERRTEVLVEGADGPGRAVYIFALASDRPIEGAVTSIYVHSLDVDGPGRRLAAMQAELEEARAALATHNDRLAALVPDEPGMTALRASVARETEAAARALLPDGVQRNEQYSSKELGGSLLVLQGASAFSKRHRLSEAKSGRKAADVLSCTNRRAREPLSKANADSPSKFAEPPAKGTGIQALASEVQIEVRSAELHAGPSHHADCDEADAHPEVRPQHEQKSRTISHDSSASSLMSQFEIGARQPLFFMHIPKTAGMSMRLYLSEQYPFDQICPAARWQGLLGREQELRSFRLVQGHFQYNLRELVAADARMLVMLRDPLRRTVSALWHLQRDPNFHQDHHLAKDLTLAEMIRHPGLMQNQRNVQAYYLCASRAPAAVSAYLERELPQNPNADAGQGEEPPDLQLALDRLASIDFVGLTEDIGSVVTAMACEMNYHPPLYFPFLNEDPNRADPLRGLTQEDLVILRDYNDLDLQIYDYAQRLIERRKFARTMDQLIGSGVYEVPPGSFEIPIAGIMPGSGWYAPDQKDGVSWRWTGPGRYFTIEVPLRQDTSYRLTLLLGGDRPPGPDDFAAEVNDVPIAFEPPQEGRRFRLELVIRGELLAQNSGYCRIRFDTRTTTRLAGSDIRELGVAVRQILFECLDD